MAFVVDASAAVPLLVDEPVSRQAETAIASAAAAGDDLHAPELLLLEAANAFWKRVQRQELSAAAAADLLGMLSSSPIVLTPDRELASRALQVATEASCTAYDGCYLALSRELGAVLVSADAQLVDAARSVGVEANLLTA